VTELENQVQDLQHATFNFRSHVVMLEDRVVELQKTSKSIEEDNSQLKRKVLNLEEILKSSDASHKLKQELSDSENRYLFEELKSRLEASENNMSALMSRLLILILWLLNFKCH
jgi:hypothetical protein